MMPKTKRVYPDTEAVDALLDEMLVDAYGEDEQFWALLEGITDALELPFDAHVVGEPVSLVTLDYDGNSRRGLVARCRRPDGREHQVAFADVELPADAPGALYLAAYCAWLGVEPKLAPPSHRTSPSGQDIDLTKPLDLVVLRVKQQALRCRPVDRDGIITLRAGSGYGTVPGQVVTLRPRKQWQFKGHPYLSGEIVDSRIDATALGLTPLRLQPFGTWDPDEHYWGEEDEPIEPCLEPVRAAGPRPMFEMEHVLPGEDPNDPFDDPILMAAELAESGDPAAAEDLLADLLETDLRCLDAHAHLGNRYFKTSPDWARRHYEVGVRIGELSLGGDAGEDPVVPWGLIDNRPWLRCMHGYGLSLWRLERWDEAVEVFERMLWLNPADNQGVRFVIDAVAAREAWVDDEA